MKKILVGTDGSEAADRAIAVAADLARVYGSPLVISHVLEELPLGDPEYGQAIKPARGHTSATIFELAPKSPVFNYRETQRPYDHRAMEVEEANARSLLARACQIAENTAQVIETDFRFGDPASEILAAADQTGADLIVLGRRGMNRVAEILLGSVSQKVLHHSKVNVLLVAAAPPVPEPTN